MSSLDQASIQSYDSTRDATAKAATPVHRGTCATVRVVGPDQLPLYQEVWSELSNVAAVPNPFYEPWMLLPALDSGVRKGTLRFLLIFGPQGSDGKEPLWGFFPLELQAKCMTLPIRTLAFWQHHRYFYLTAPLVDGRRVREVLDAFWRWFERNPFGCRILDTNHLLAEGPFHKLWADFAIGRSAFVVIDFPRAFLQPSEAFASYVTSAISKKHYDEFLRLERKLAALGKLEYRAVDNISGVDRWIDEFLLLEASGWKGGDGGRAFAKETEHSTYLRKITREGFLRKRTMLLSMVLEGKTIAMKHSILAGNGGFTIKIAYDEEYSKYSPGVLLELENIRRVCENPEIHWLDSCADPRHVMANRIWRERRMIRRTLFSDSSNIGDFWISAIPVLRWVNKQVRSKPVPRHFQVSTKLQSYQG